MSVVLLGSTSGSVTLQEPAVAGSTTINLPATSGTMAVLPTATSVLPEASGGTGTTTGYYGFKSRIINGGMVIDQRNAGASVSASTTGAFVYTLDRWAYAAAQASKFTIQQNAGSVTPPAGFQNYLGVTVGASANVTVGATDYFVLRQAIEGYNVADLGFGAAGASTVTLSFWVRSSLTGSFGGALQNSDQLRSYPFLYTISAANTWEQKTVTIAGDTAGTWLKTNGQGLSVLLSIGMGSSYVNTAGSWYGSFAQSATGATNLISTNSATFYITGVQLEKGSTATSFDYRPYGTELALCQRYYETGGRNGWVGYSSGSGASVISFVGYRVTKRAAATITIPSYALNFVTSVGPYSVTTDGFEINGTTSGASSQAYIITNSWSASIEL
jgi:hypothetical protein